MEYRYGKNENYEDFSSGRVLYHVKGVTNFPVRLAQELYGRCLEYLDKKDDICLYDCCCGGGYLLTVLGFLNQDTLSEILGSDIDEKSIEIAEKNLLLLTEDGMQRRVSEIKEMIGLYNKQSHKDAEISALKLKDLLKHTDLRTNLYVANVLEKIPVIKTPDIIITDVPYGNLVTWEGSGEGSGVNTRQGSGQKGVDMLLNSLYEICDDYTIIGICMDKNQKISSERFTRLEKQLIGKRKFEILRKKVI